VSQKTTKSAAPNEGAGAAAGGLASSRGASAVEPSPANGRPDPATGATAGYRFPGWLVQPVPARAVLAAALVCLLIALLLTRGPLSAVDVFIALAASLGLLSLHLAVAGRNADVAAPDTAGGKLERRLEQLQDLQWELSENEQRYRALLDSQEDMILRRDEAGRLTFVNKAFLGMFAVTADEVLGQSYKIDAKCEEGREPLTTAADVRHQRFTQLVETASGPRWIEWEEQLVPAADGSSLEVQSVGRDVTHQRFAETQLAEARDQAETANRAKSRFLAAMSHEIRTPMNGIMGMASLLMETPQTPEQQTYARAIDQSARTLLALIDEILDFSKIEAGKLELSDVPFALETSVQEVVELLAPRAHEKGLEMAWWVDAHPPVYVSGDEARVRQILLNLLSNAVKFTDSGGVSVHASVREDAEWSGGDRLKARFVVEDTGIGMSHEDMQGLFAEFEQADAAIRRSDGGTGLGLAISMQLARAMDGDIHVMSAPGKGSTFTVELSLRNATPHTDVREGGSALAGPGRVLLAFDRTLERKALSHALKSAKVPAEECDFAAAGALIDAAAGDGRPFDSLVVDSEHDAAAAGRLLEKAHRANQQRQVRGLVLVNVLARARLSDFRSAGFEAYLVRPVRPASLMMQLGLNAAPPTDTGKMMSQQPDAPAANVGSDGAPRRVLLAEDNEINSLLAKRILEKCGCDYVAVSNGKEAVAEVRRAIAGETPPIDLILMDIFMPQLDGIGAARAINELYAQSECGSAAPPIVALTASAFAEDKKRYLEAGMNDYLAKPFDKASLEAVLRQWLGQRAGGDADAAA
jgi:PAS domain S-box-containing protein